MGLQFQLDGKKALVCGASQGIGEACAVALAQAGVQVLALARTETKLKNLVDKLTSINPALKHDYLAVDLTQVQNLKTVLPEKLQTFGGGVDILICNTGGPKGGSLLEAEADEFRKAFEMHVLVNSYLAQTLVPGMKKNKYGRIINIISTSVKAPIPNLGVSNTIRAAVANWAKTLSQEVASAGVTVNNILPGYTRTERLKALAAAAAQKRGVSEEVIEKEWLAQIPAARFGESSDIANAVTFLASPFASYINGVNLPIDGGRTPSL